MFTIQRAQKKDEKEIQKILKLLDLEIPSLRAGSFFLAKIDDKTAGIMSLADHGDFLFLSSVGVLPELEGRGTARKLLEGVINKKSKDIYLYTKIPDFFKKFGFEIADGLFGKLPSKAALECENCEVDKCVTMVKKTAGLRHIKLP